MNILTIGGKEYILKYNFKALADLQEYGIQFTASADFRLKDIAKLLELGLRMFQPTLTNEDCYGLIDTYLEDNELNDMMLVVSKAMSSALGKRKPTAPQ